MSEPDFPLLTEHDKEVIRRAALAPTEEALWAFKATREWIDWALAIDFNSERFQQVDQYADYLHSQRKEP